MERYLPTHDKIHTGNFYYSYRLTPRFLKARRIMVLHYSATKLFIATITSLLLMAASFFLCRSFHIDSFFFFMGMVGITCAIIWIAQAVFRFLRLYLSDPQGKWVKREHHKLAPGYIGETDSELFYMDFLSTLEKEYTRIVLPEGVPASVQRLVESSPYYKQIKRYTHSLRYRGFTKKEKQILLAAASEIAADKIASDQLDFFNTATSFFS